MKKWVLIIVPFLVLIIVFCCWFFNTRVIFERKLYFALPESAKIISQSYDLYGDCLEVKIKFDFDDYKTIFDGIKNFNEINGLWEEEDDTYLIISFDREVEKFVSAYFGVRQGLWGEKTRYICILVTQDKHNPEHYFLSVYY